MNTTKPTDNSDGMIDSGPETFPFAGSWQLDWYNANDGNLFQSDRVTFDQQGYSVGTIDANTYHTQRGWIPYDENASWRIYHLDGELKIINHYGMAFRFAIGNFDDDKLNGIGTVGGGVWSQTLQRETRSR